MNHIKGQKIYIYTYSI